MFTLVEVPLASDVFKKASAPSLLKNVITGKLANANFESPPPRAGSYTTSKSDRSLSYVNSAAVELLK